MLAPSPRSEVTWTDLLPRSYTGASNKDSFWKYTPLTTNIKYPNGLNLLTTIHCPLMWLHLRIWSYNFVNIYCIYNMYWIYLCSCNGSHRKGWIFRLMVKIDTIDAPANNTYIDVLQDIPSDLQSTGVPYAPEFHSSWVPALRLWSFGGRMHWIKNKSTRHWLGGWMATIQII